MYVVTEAKYIFPYWVNYITWTLVVLSCAISASFVVFYSLEWGKTKSEEWLSSLLLSICQSVVIIQPIKVKLRTVSKEYLPLKNTDLN